MSKLKFISTTNRSFSPQEELLPRKKIPNAPWVAVTVGGWWRPICYLRMDTSWACVRGRAGWGPGLGLSMNRSGQWLRNCKMTEDKCRKNSLLSDSGGINYKKLVLDFSFFLGCSIFAIMVGFLPIFLSNFSKYPGLYLFVLHLQGLLLSLY